jgi:hypothetical protein
MTIQSQPSIRFFGAIAKWCAVRTHYHEHSQLQQTVTTHSCLLEAAANTDLGLFLTGCKCCRGHVQPSQDDWMHNAPHPSIYKGTDCTATVVEWRYEKVAAHLACNSHAQPPPPTYHSLCLQPLDTQYSSRMTCIKCTHMLSSDHSLSYNW